MLYFGKKNLAIALICSVHCTAENSLPLPNFSDIFDLCLHWVSVVSGWEYVCCYTVTSGTEVAGLNYFSWMDRLRDFWAGHWTTFIKKLFSVNQLLHSIFGLWGMFLVSISLYEVWGSLGEWNTVIVTGRKIIWGYICTYTVTVTGRKIILEFFFKLYWEIFMVATALHFGNFVTARAAKSIISSKWVFNPSYELPGVFKIKILYLNLIMDNIWAKLWA